MSDGYPSMTALLGLLALAGYQNRDKIAGYLGGGDKGTHDTPAPGTQPAAAGGVGGFLGGLLGGRGDAASGGFINGGLGEMLQRFQQAGHGEAAQSWVAQGPNREIEPGHLEQAIGPEVMNDLTRRTGLSRDELLTRLSRELPSAVDRYTPDGRVPA